MLGHGVSLELPGSKDPLAAAFDRAPPLEPWLAWVVEAEQLAWWGLADGQTRHADVYRE
jgi:hypothetical protein